MGNKIPPRVLTTSEAREIGKIGGIKSGEARRKRMQMREELELLLETPYKDGMSHQTAGLAEMVRRFAISGDPDYFVKIRDSVGEKPCDKHEMIGALSVNEYATEIERRLFNTCKNQSDSDRI